MQTRLSLILVCGAAVVMAACSADNPNRPDVTFTAPLAQGPAGGTIFRFNQQPVTLTIENAARTADVTVTYNVEIATAPSFSPIFRTIEGIAEGAGGTTTVTVANLPGGTTFFWRWRAVVGDTVGQPSPAAEFFVRPQVILGVPDAEEPAANRDIYTPKPTFTVRNGTRTGPVGAITYEFEVSTVATFASVVVRVTGIAEGNVRTSWTPANDLPEGTLFWRARAVDLFNEEASPFTAASRFERKRGIDLNSVIYQFGANIASWPQTSLITDAYHSNGLLCIFHTKLGVWPVQDFFDAGPILEGNQQLFALINGQWYGGSADWYRPGQACKSVDNNIGPDSFPGVNPIGSWRPQPGEVFGIMATTPARMWPAMKTLDERSDVWLIQW